MGSRSCVDESYALNGVDKSSQCSAIGAEYSRLQADAENARRSQQRLYEIANSPSGNPPRPILTQEFTTKTVITPGPMEKVRAAVMQLAWLPQILVNVECLASPGSYH